MHKKHRQSAREAWSVVTTLAQTAYRISAKCDLVCLRRSASFSAESKSGGVVALGVCFVASGKTVPTAGIVPCSTSHGGETASDSVKETAGNRCVVGKGHVFVATCNGSVRTIDTVLETTTDKPVFFSDSVLVTTSNYRVLQSRI